MRAVLFSTSFLPCVGNQIFSVLKFLRLLFQVVQKLLSFKGACGCLGGLILLPQACREQCILRWGWWVRKRERERRRKREKERAVSSYRYAILQKHNTDQQGLRTGESSQVLPFSMQGTCKLEKGWDLFPVTGHLRSKEEPWGSVLQCSLPIALFKHVGLSDRAANTG